MVIFDGYCCVVVAAGSVAFSGAAVRAAGGVRQVICQLLELAGEGRGGLANFLSLNKDPT